MNGNVTFSELTPEIIGKIIGFIDLDSLLNLRFVNKRIYEEITRIFQNRYPILNKQHFAISTTKAFKELSPGHNLNTVALKQAMTEGWRLYYQIALYAKRHEDHRNNLCFLEIYSEKYVIFNNKIRDAYKPQSLIIEPQTWCPEINDTWILAHMHHGHNFRLLALPNHEESFWDNAANRPTALGRELYQLWSSGYRISMPDIRAFPCKGNPYNGTGIFLRAPENFEKPPIMQDAIVNNKAQIDALLQALQNAAQGRTVKLPKGALGYRQICKDCGETITRRWTKDKNKNWAISNGCKFCMLDIIL